MSPPTSNLSIPMRPSNSGTATGGTPARMINQPTLVEHKNLKFLIADAPSDSNLPLFMKEFERHNVSDVVRVCDPTYSKEPLITKGIKVHDWSFSDGEAPPTSVVDDWLKLVENRFGRDPSNVPGSTVCVHCVAGLGRAPVLVAIALIEQGMAPVDALVYVRERRRGAINHKQLKYIEGYKRRSKGKCVIM